MGFSIGADGTATLLPFWLLNPTTPQGLAISPSATALYAALSAGPRAYSIDTASGSLTTGGDSSGGTAPSAVALSPSGKQLYVANTGSDSISRYLINADGSLPAAASATKLNGVGTAPDGLAMTPDGRFLYVADSGTGKGAISAYSVDSVTGDLTPLASSPIGVGTSNSAPAGLTIAASGGYLYAALKGDNKVAAWSIDGATGALAPLADPIHPDGTYPAGSAPLGIALSSDGTRLLVADSGDSAVARYLVTAGVPLRLPSSGDPQVTGARSVTISLDGTRAYVGGTAGVAAFDLSVLGVMTPHGTAQATGATLAGLAITPDQGPIARVNPVAAPATTASRFQGGPSLDSDGRVVKWSWQFGDGTTGDGDTVTHVYAGPGTYTVTLTVTDNEGCSTTAVYTGQQLACVPSGLATWSQAITIPPAPDNTVPSQPCAHDGNDGFCGTPDQKAPQATILGINDGATIYDIDAPSALVGSITPDPSGIKSVKMRFGKAGGTVRITKTVRKRLCRIRRVHGKKRRSCTRRKVAVRVVTKVPACQTFAGNRAYLVTYQCSRLPWFPVTSADGTFRYDLPVALGLGSYTVDVLATDGAGNTDVLEKGRDSISFKIVKTPADTGTGAGNTSGGTTTGTTSPPVSDTGSPFR